VGPGAGDPLGRTSYVCPAASGSVLQGSKTHPELLGPAGPSCISGYFVESQQQAAGVRVVPSHDGTRHGVTTGEAFGSPGLLFKQGQAARCDFWARVSPLPLLSGACIHQRLLDPERFIPRGCSPVSLEQQPSAWTHSARRISEPPGRSSRPWSHP